MKNSSKVLSLVGLATRAGKTVSGEFSTEKSVKTGKGFLVLVAEDASENTRKKFRDMCDFYEVPVYVFGDKEELENTAEGNSAPALRFRMKILRKQS